MQGMDVSAQQTLSNASVYTTNTTTLSNTTNNNNGGSDAFDQLKDRYLENSLTTPVGRLVPVSQLI